MKKVIMITMLVLAILISTQTQAFAIHEGTPNTTTQLIDNCKSANPSETCISTVAANGTIIVIPGTPPPVQQPLIIDEVNGGYETGEESYTDIGDSDEVPRQSSGNDDNDNNDSGDDKDEEEKTYCDVPNPSNPCHDRRDVSETTGLATCIDGSHEEDWRDCKGGGAEDEAEDEESGQYDDDDNDRLPNCNDVEAGTHCDDTEDEDSWLDEEE
jgi:hypothetical protein